MRAMDYNYVLNKQPHLRLVNINDVTSRLLEVTNGEVFIVFNSITANYELHSINSFNEECNSCNAVIEDDWLNNQIVKDYLANNHKKFAQEIEDNRTYMSEYYQNAESKREFAMTTGRLDIVKRTLGRNV